MVWIARGAKLNRGVYFLGLEKPEIRPDGTPRNEIDVQEFSKLFDADLFGQLFAGVPLKPGEIRKVNRFSTRPKPKKAARKLKVRK